jgi:hypothetical protein
MEDILVYIKRTREERRSHLKLDEPCYSRGGQSMYNKGLLAYLHNTTMPKGHSAQVCHGCHNGECDNPNHLYWGTPRDNYDDYIENGGLTIGEKVKQKYASDELSEINRQNGSSGWSKGGKANASKPKSEEHRKKLSEASKKDWERRKAQVVQR